MNPIQQMHAHVRRRDGRTDARPVLTRRLFVSREDPLVVGTPDASRWHEAIFTTIADRGQEAGAA